MIRRSAVVSLAVACLLFAVALSADTLVMRDGRRIEGVLVGIRNGVIDFEAQRGRFGGRERIRVERDEVRRIELDDRSESRDDFDDRDRDRDRDRDDDRDRGGRPSGLRERVVSVDGAVSWTDTGVDVRAGQTVYFDAGGRVRWGPGSQDGPGGAEKSPRNPNSPMPGRPAAALIGRIGGGEDYFFVGDDKGPIRMRSSGRLFLGVNDDQVRDNSGAFRVTVSY